MSIPHLFQITKAETVEDFFEELVELYEWIGENNDKITEKLDGVSFSTKIIGDEFVYIDKSGRYFALYDLVQSNFPQNLRNKLIQCLKKFNFLYRNGLKGYFLRLGLDEKDTFLNFEYVNGRQNSISYKTEAIFFNSFVKSGEEVVGFNLTPEETPSIGQIFALSPPPSYHPSRHPLRSEAVLKYTQRFDLPGDSQGLPTTTKMAELKPSMTRKNFSVFRQSGTCENLAAMTVLEHYTRFCQTVIDAQTWREQISDSCEGLVVTGFKDYPKFKLIGDFFLDNVETENRFNSYFVAMAGMKPPHKGHMRLIVETLNRCKKFNSKFRLFLSEARRDKISLEASKKVLELYLMNEDVDASKLEIEILDGNGTFAAVEEFVKVLDSGATVYFVCGDQDAEKTKESISYFEKTYPDIFFEISSVRVEKQTESNKKISATDMRAAVKNNNFALFRTFLPEKSLKDGDKVWEILRSCYDEATASAISTSNYDYNKMPRIRIG